ncbi:MAG: putative nucleic acid-binding protein [Cellvibrionaceae bacterium]|jgi:predicted nucleic acid-binding protein
MVVVLDTGPLGLLTNPKRSEMNRACNHWLQGVALAGTRIIVPEIADYELRRELLRANKSNGLKRLDALIQALDYLPITTEAMRQAAGFWAQARQQGQPTAGDNTLDGDMILAGQVATLRENEIVIATTNVGHLSRFMAAELWVDIRP